MCFETPSQVYNFCTKVISGTKFRFASVRLLEIIPLETICCQNNQIVYVVGECSLQWDIVAIREDALESGCNWKLTL